MEVYGTELDTSLHGYPLLSLTQYNLNKIDDEPVFWDFLTEEKKTLICAALVDKPVVEVEEFSVIEDKQELDTWVSEAIASGRSGTLSSKAKK